MGTDWELGKVLPASWNWGQYHIYLDGTLKEVFSAKAKYFEQRKDRCDLFLATHKRPSLEGHFRQVAITAALALAGKPMPNRPTGPKLCVNQKRLSFAEYGQMISRSKAVCVLWVSVSAQLVMSMLLWLGQSC